MQLPQCNPPGSAALSHFCSQDESQQQEFTPELRSILEMTARTGKYWHDWSLLRPLLHFRLKQVLKELHESRSDGASEKVFYDVLKRLGQELNSFTEGAPFTLQRICEILLSPPASYSNIDKLDLAFEKLLLVTSTFPPCSDPYYCPPPSSEQASIDNGVDPSAVDLSAAAPPTGDVPKGDTEMEDAAAAPPQDSPVMANL